MVSSRIDKQLNLVSSCIRACHKCGLSCNEKVLPVWTGQSKHLMVLSGKHQLKDKHLWDSLGEHGFEKDDMYILFAVNCTTDKTKAKGKIRLTNPSDLHIEACGTWRKHHLDIIAPNKILCIGSSATRAITGCRYRDFVKGTAKDYMLAISRKCGIMVPVIATLDDKEHYDKTIERWKSY